MSVLRVILADQLSTSISSLEGCNKEEDLVLLSELFEEATYVKHHKKKIALLFSAMRHFVLQLKEEGYRVEFIKIEDPSNTGTLKGEIERVLKSHVINKVIVTHPGEFRILQNIESWGEDFNIDVEIKPDSRFLCSIEEFSLWAANRTQLRMEYFYRYIRQKYSILINNNQPVGGKWNYDDENRKSPKTEMKIPSAFAIEADEITKEVLKIIEIKFPDHFGDLTPFNFAVNREQALAVLEHFIVERLKSFGDYQDAMIEGEPWMYHSHLSFYLNCGLLLPMECIKAAEAAYFEGLVPLNACEGFIRQIMGWREYVRGIYWIKMPIYKELNFLEATRRLPEFYWSANTKMNCIKQCVKQTKELAYAHHIQRLMVLGNFALLAGLSPEEVNEWYLIVYADAYEWVELPNVTGMILFADGGFLGSKPYASSGAYINKMSDYCKNCAYKVTEKNGVNACPFNYLYWNFLNQNRKKLFSNQRIGMMYRSYDNMDDQKKDEIENDSKRFFKMLEQNEFI